MSGAHWPEGLVDFSLPTRIVAGRGSITRLGSLVAPLGKRVVLVTDDGLVKSGLVEKAVNSLRSAHLDVHVFDRAQPNPTESDVENCRAAVAPFAPDVWLGFGGGSALDTAKAAALLSTNGGRMRDFWGWEKATRAAPPIVAVPTTAGTGSETQSHTLVSRDDDHRKMACGHPSLAPRLVLLDPELTVSCPRDVTITSALDTLVHGLETLVSTKANGLSRAWSIRTAFSVFGALPMVLEDPTNLPMRETLQWASALGGLAIETSMLGAAHAAANPLTARLDVPHGRAVALMIVPVMRLNANHPVAAAHYRTLAAALGFDDVHSLIDRTRSLLHRVAPTLAADVADRAKPLLATLSRDAADQWTGRFNPVPVDAATFERLYADALV